MLIPKIFFILLFVQATAFAGTIKQVKNGKALLSLDGEPTEVGDQIYALNEASKKTAILEITKVKGDQAIATIVKGSAKASDRTEFKAKGTGATAAATTTDAAVVEPTKVASRTFVRFDRIKIALNLKYIMDSIISKQEDIANNSEEVSMTGGNIGINASLDYPIKPWLYLRGYGGYEMLNAKGTAKFLSCSSKTSTDCNVAINYLSAGALLRLNYNLTSVQLWGGLGAGIKQPLTKKSTALKEENIALANTAILAFGMDYHMSNKYFIPASFEYHHSFNTSDTVPKIGNMAVEIGFGILF